jgi:sugar phosphate permease
VAQGAVATLQGIGAASSGLITGMIVDHVGYTAAFLVRQASRVRLLPPCCC